MPYATPARLIELFGEEEMLHLTNLYDPDAAAIAEPRILASIAWAEGVCNSYVSVRYPVPLATVPMVLESYVADIARYQLDSIAPREDVRRRYEDAIAWLKLLAKGEVDLGPDLLGIEEVEDEPLIGGDVAIEVGEAVFSEAALSGF